MDLSGLNHPDRKLENQYKKTFFKNRQRLKWRAPIVCGAIVNILKPEKLIDVGCATGDLIAEFLAMKIDAYGIEGSCNCREYLECPGERVFTLDLRVPIVSILNRYDLATCFEVAEHIESDYSDIFVDNLTMLSERIILSAAQPGQGGRCHWNCQPAEYWNEKFLQRGYYYNNIIVKALRAEWSAWRKQPGIKAYYENLLYFEKQE
jgi:hypothetical protein